MQVRYSTKLSLQEYIEQEAWNQAYLDHCPFHPEGGCGLARHGFYARKLPEYCLIARYYCPKGHTTIGLIPDFFCSRLPGTLDEVEHAVNVAQESKSQEEAAEKLRPEITLTSALRWLRRRIRYVREALTTAAGLFTPGCHPDLKSFRQWLSSNRVLFRLRRSVSDFLQHLPPVVGFGPRITSRYFNEFHLQQ
ncbi:MAG: hypothetical protein J7J07_04625 [Syntrophobacterales bacterium]|nr:hypothetical protein [Syntrophobacterales bacterium]